MHLTLGLAGQAKLTVSPEDTATSMHSGEVDVLATPRMMALCEEACLAAIEGHLDDGATTVGTRVEIDHLAPCGPGTEVVAEAILDDVNGRMLCFSVSARDRRVVLGKGRVIRAVVDTERFMEKLRSQGS